MDVRQHWRALARAGAQGLPLRLVIRRLRVGTGRSFGHSVVGCLTWFAGNQWASPRHQGCSQSLLKDRLAFSDIINVL